MPVNLYLGVLCIYAFTKMFTKFEHRRRKPEKKQHAFGHAAISIKIYVAQ